MFYHATTDEGLAAIRRGDPLVPTARSADKSRRRSIKKTGGDPEIRGRGVFLSDIPDGARVLPKRPHRLHIKLSDTEKRELQRYNDIRVPTDYPGKYADHWYVSKKPIPASRVVEVEKSPWSDF